MKVIFLDNDGVICLSTEWGSRFKKQRAHFNEANPRNGFGDNGPVEVRLDNFNKKAITILNQIIEETGAEIIVSSDWKLHATLEELGDYYIEQGISKRPVAFTPNLGDWDSESDGLFSWKGWYSKKRILEINKYLELNPNVEQWVAIDDLNMSPEYNQGHGLDNFVLTARSNEGIKQSGIKEKVLKFLNK